VRRTVFLLALALVLVGCQSGDGFYYKAAKDEAARVATKDPFRGYSDEVSVGAVQERRDCSQAPSAQAGPCLKAAVTPEFPTRDLSGRSDTSGRLAQVTFDVFFWLKKNRGGLKVTHTSSRPTGATVEGSWPDVVSTSS
jgi:hypothetical protein